MRKSPRDPATTLAEIGTHLPARASFVVFTQ